MKPVTVTVHWSENPVFDAGRQYPFADFEGLAAHAIAGATIGYDKTKITVHFDDGSIYCCRLDLGEQADQGFRHYAEIVMQYQGGELADYLARITW